MQINKNTDLKDGFSERLKTALELAGISGSIRAKGERLGVSKSFMDAMLRGEKMPSREKSVRIAALCGVREGWLVAGEMPIRHSITPKIAIEHWSKEDQEALLTIWRSIESKYTKEIEV